MKEMLAAGGAQMGQRSARVTRETATAAGSGLTAQSLSTESTWTPTFGVLGLDVSNWQPSVDWQSEWNKGARFAYVKASEGTYYTNGIFNSQYQGARNVGMIRGAYHFANPSSSSGADQARFFANNGGGWSADGFTMPPVLDIEYNPYDGNICYDLTPAQMTAWIKDFGSTMLALTGRFPVIYSTTDWWSTCTNNSAAFGDYPLWIASYTPPSSSSPGVLPASWDYYSIWQFSSQGPFAGDSNVWNGDYAGLKAFAGSGVPLAATQAISSVQGRTPELGAPTSAIVCGLRDGGCYQNFQNGAIIWSPTTGAYASPNGPIRSVWASTSYEQGTLGYPTSAQTCGLTNNGCYQNFQNGAIIWSPTTGAYASPNGPIRTKWGSMGYERSELGYPTSSVVCGIRDGGCYQNFQGGAMLWSQSTGAQPSTGAIRARYASLGYENSFLGYPTAATSCTLAGGACYQNYQGGSITWSPTAGTSVSTTRR